MLIYVYMTTTLETAVQQAKELPKERQDELAELILLLVGQDRQMPVIAY